MKQASTDGPAGVQFSTAQLPPEDRNDAWRHLIAALASMKVDGRAPIDASLVSYNLGSMVLARCHSGAVHYVRNETLVKRSLLDGHVLLQLLLEGRGLARFDGAPTELQAGDICLIDLAHDAELRFERPSEHIDVLIPRDALNDVGQGLHGRVLQQGQSLCRMLTEHLLQLFDMLPSLTSAHTDTMARATLAVLRICLDDRGAAPPHASTQADSVLARMLAYIDAHLGNAELGAAMLQRDFRISRATLYRLFTEYGGVTHCIREKRLHGAFHDLHNHPHQQISEVVFRWGFSCERQFQRAFQSRFGMTPSAVRRQGERVMHATPFVGASTGRYLLQPAN